MTRRAGPRLAAAALVAAWSIGAAPAASDRATVVLRYDCRSEIERRELTLFANGTLRLRRAPQAASPAWNDDMRLVELPPGDLAGYLGRLRAEDLVESGSPPPGVEGEWVERCRLELRLPEAAPRDFEFGRYDPLPLAVSRLARVADELVERAADPRYLAAHLPTGYRPRPGDVLRRADGERFTVVGWTSDKQGIELAGVDQPLTLYLDLDTLASTFVAVESRRPE